MFKIEVHVFLWGRVLLPSPLLARLHSSWVGSFLSFSSPSVLPHLCPLQPWPSHVKAPAEGVRPKLVQNEREKQLIQ